MNLLIGTVFSAGILSFFSPCIVPLIPVYIGILTEQEHASRVKLGPLRINVYAVGRTALFILGLSTAFMMLGLGAGALGSVIRSTIFYRFIGLIVVLMGLQQIGLFRLSFLNKERKLHLERSRKKDYIGAFLLGLTFSFGWTPCVGPVLGTVLGLAVNQGKTLAGMFYMFVYSVGLAIPFLFITLFSDFAISHVSFFEKHLRKIQIIGGILIVIMGLLLMFDRLSMITKLTGL